MSDAAYWIGKGVVRVDGTSYGYGEALPVDKISKETLARWQADGLVGSAPIAAVKGDAKAEARIKELEAEISALKNEKGKRKGACKDCAKKDKAIEEQAKIAADHKARIAELEGLLEAATMPADGGDGATGDE